MLKELLETLRDGKNVVLSTVPNQYGGITADKILALNEGKYQLSFINCYSSQGLGLGTCQCVSHPCMGWKQVSRREALAEIRLVVAKQLAEKKQVNREIAWLDKVINELS